MGDLVTTRPSDPMETAIVGGVRGSNPLRLGSKNNRTVRWQVERGARHNYRLLGKRLSRANRNLFRNGKTGKGLIHVLSDGTHRLITKAGQLAPIVVDTFSIQVIKDGTIKSDLPPTTHLNAMLSAETFLKQFRPVDHIARTPIYLDDFSIAQPGYQDCGGAGRLLYLGVEPRIADHMETIARFLDVMDFASDADRCNTVAAALTILLRHHWPGAKPLVPVTATKSHAGKGTICDFIRGSVAKADVLYECMDWPMQHQFQQQCVRSPDIGVVNLDNIRLDSAGGRARCIRSAFLESFLTSPEIQLASPGLGEPMRRPNHFVVTLTTNDGLLSPDLLNRALPIHLAPKGNIQNRQSPIGNPKLEFLPAHQAQIEAELRGMIERWKVRGRPLDTSAKHSMTTWAQTIGGILQVNGFTGFLQNYAARRTWDDPVRNALAILAGAAPGQALRPKDWADLVVREGLTQALLSASDRESASGRERGIGVVFSRHLDETFEAQTPTTWVRVQLVGGFRRWSKGKNPFTSYEFRVLDERALTVDE